jgi:hypothetical protein
LPTTYQTADTSRRSLRLRLYDDNITEVLLIRLSLVLNRATFGPADMTFFARNALSCERSGYAKTF